MNLLYTDENSEKSVNVLSDETYLNLAIDEIISMIAVTTDEENLLKKTFTNVPNDYETANYRQEILKDFMHDEDLCLELSEVLKSLDVLKEYRDNVRFTIEKKSSLYELINYITEMEVYIKIIEDLNILFAKHEVRSRGLITVRELLKEVIAADKITELKEIVSSLKAETSTLKSVTVGINLTPELRPEEIKILFFNTAKYPSQFDKKAFGVSIQSGYEVRYREPSQFMKYIADDMEKELSKNVQRHKKKLREYVNLKGYFLLDICNDLRVYLMLAKFGRKLQSSNFTITFPKVCEVCDEVVMKEIYNVRLTKNTDAEIVTNDFTFSKDENIFILTGPNRGGKTMLTQALGINALFASLGFFVMASSYEGFLFSEILTHFPADENLTLDLGRLGEEATRVQKIVKNADRRTLVLLNETYSSTSSSDGLYLAMDLVHILKYKGVPTVFNTHILDLARNCKKMNEWEGDSDVISITMEMKDNVNTYRVLRSEPDGTSFARNIALKYGVTYEQLLDS